MIILYIAIELLLQNFENLQTKLIETIESSWTSLDHLLAKLHMTISCLTLNLKEYLFLIEYIQLILLKTVYDSR